MSGTDRVPSIEYIIGIDIPIQSGVGYIDKISSFVNVATNALYAVNPASLISNSGNPGVVVVVFKLSARNDAAYISFAVYPANIISIIEYWPDKPVIVNPAVFKSATVNKSVCKS